jgi:carbon-monoxide dehydrogenase small subunit
MCAGVKYAAIGIVAITGWLAPRLQHWAAFSGWAMATQSTASLSIARTTYGYAWRPALLPGRSLGSQAREARMIEFFRPIAVTVNGEDVRETVDPRMSLVDFLRERLGLTGSHVGCEQGACGACTVRLDGVTVRGCLVLAVQCAGSKVETIEGVSDAGEIGDLQDAFVRRNALQCGFCTPGMLLAAQELLASRERAGGVPSREAIRAHLSGNYCRCTGYQAIVDAVEAVAMARTGRNAP